MYFLLNLMEEDTHQLTKRTFLSSHQYWLSLEPCLWPGRWSPNQKQTKNAHYAVDTGKVNSRILKMVPFQVLKAERVPTLYLLTADRILLTFSLLGEWVCGSDIFLLLFASWMSMSLYWYEKCLLMKLRYPGFEKGKERAEFECIFLFHSTRSLGLAP